MLFSRLLVALVVLGFVVVRAPAADYGVISSGSWSATSTWSGSVVPGVNDNAFVGSTTPGTAIPTATVTLTQNVTAGNVYLGHDTGTSGTLALGDFTFTGQDLYFGFVGSGAITRGIGRLDVARFDVRNAQSFTLAPTDVVRQAIDVAEGSTLTHGANLTTSVDIDLRDSGTVFNSQGFNVQTNQFLLGWNNTGTPQWLNRGNLTANQLLVRGQNFQLTPTDSVGRFTLSAGNTNLGAGVVVGRLDLLNGATATTVATGHLTAYVSVESGGTLTLGANLSLSDKLSLLDTGTVLNAAGKDISAASQILLGWDGGTPVLQNRGKLTSNELLVKGQNFNLTAADSINNFFVDGATTALGSGVVVQRLQLQNAAVGTSAASGNVVKSVTLQSGASLTLGADLTLTENVNIQGAGTVLNVNGHVISTPSQCLHGWDATGTPVLQYVGRLTVGELLQGNGAQLTLASGQDTAGHIGLHGNSRLTAAVSAAGTGLTLTQAAASELDIQAGSQLTLTNGGVVDGWAFRWANPTGGHHVADLNNLIALGRIDFGGGNFTIASNPDGYTYVFVPVPEPASVLAVCAAAAGLAAGVRRVRARRPGRSA